MAWLADVSGDSKLALELFFGMAREDDPDERTFVAALSASEPPVPFVGSSLVDMYAKCGDMVKARAVFKRMPSRDVVVWTSLIQGYIDNGVGWKTIKLWGVNFYRKCGVMSAAEHLFGSLAVRDIVAWNALITGFGQQGDMSRVFEAFREMREDGVRANAITFVSVITACSHGGLVERGREFFQAMDPDSGIVCGIHHYSSLVDLLTDWKRP
ncbi:putative pentatricopeptide repeat-containing protein At5g52630 [Selaginella moellendorffii]|uniref:putative pentatricopeptide repeat-containing protein At5g52630 n=1 Tax=Selaginella moellendorffii TaxID=88036 RepID=UPI000D1C6918|nr:putative pentatricopeptide repeat-containing protein At5g52630 [Selaginella moellendorffii]|eukprot:XP_024542068.1 putative pentatricopeptide repeat-containing protein At5g52630 [Selaginella moellendorffii]